MSVMMRRSRCAMCDVAELLHAPMVFHLKSEGLQEVAGPSHLVWQVCLRAGAADHGSRKFASGQVQRHLRACCHPRRSAVGRSRHSGHDIICLDNMEGVKKSQRYHGRVWEENVAFSWVKISTCLGMIAPPTFPLVLYL